MLIENSLITWLSLFSPLHSSLYTSILFTMKCMKTQMWEGEIRGEIWERKRSGTGTPTGQKKSEDDASLVRKSDWFRERGGRRWSERGRERARWKEEARKRENMREDEQLRRNLEERKKLREKSRGKPVRIVRYGNSEKTRTKEKNKEWASVRKENMERDDEDRERVRIERKSQGREW